VCKMVSRMFSPLARGYHKIMIDHLKGTFNVYSSDFVVKKLNEGKDKELCYLFNSVKA